jgi:hypothetical protein
MLVEWFIDIDENTVKSGVSIICNTNEFYILAETVDRTEILHDCYLNEFIGAKL